MPLQKIAGLKTLVDLHADVRKSVAAPTLSIYHPARGRFSVLSAELLGVTALTNPVAVEAIIKAAEPLTEEEDEAWTQEDARTVLAVAGSLPAPSHVLTWRLNGQGMLLFKAVEPETPKSRALVYPPGNRPPEITVLAALRREGINVAKGTCLEVPVKLVEDEDGLALAAFLRLGELRSVSGAEEEAEAEEPTVTGG